MIHALVAQWIDEGHSIVSNYLNPRVDLRREFQQWSQWAVAKR